LWYFTEEEEISMKKLLTVAAIGGLMAIGAMAETLSGTISDSKCGAKHEAASEADAKCVAGCVKKGADAVLISDGKVYKLVGDKDEVMKHLGHKVSVTGKVEGDSIDVQSIKM
jgi:hypothetical protein